MQKRILLAAVIISLTFNIGLTCNYIPIPFCISAKGEGGLIVSAIVADSIPFGMKLKVLEIFKGNEVKDTIIMWDQVNDSCMGAVWFFMEAKGIGSFGDTVIAILDKIESVRYGWENINDYYYPHPIYSTVLRLKNGILRSEIGLISGYPGGGYCHNCIIQMSYSSFINQVELCIDNGLIPTGIERKNHTRPELVISNSDRITIEAKNMANENLNFQLYNVSGQILHTKQLTQYKTVITPNVTDGLYIYSVTNNEGKIYAKGKVLLP